MRQSDDLVRSYTVGKCMMACKFDPDARVPSHELTNQWGDGLTPSGSESALQRPRNWYVSRCVPCLHVLISMAVTTAAAPAQLCCRNGVVGTSLASSSSRRVWDR
jgi:hypothetical protein